MTVVPLSGRRSDTWFQMFMLGFPKKWSGMKKNSVFTAELVAAVALLLLAVAVLWQLFPDLKSDVGAAWVQAVFSVVAIVGAFLISTRQHAMERAFDAARRNQDDLRRFETVKALLTRIDNNVRILRHMWGASQMDDLNPITIDYLKDCKVAFDALPIFEIPDAELVIFVAGIPRSIQDLIVGLTKAKEDSDQVTMNEALYAHDVDELVMRLELLTERAANICRNRMSELAA